MARSYAIVGSAAVTANSVSLPIAELVSAATVRPKIYDVILGGEGTPADNSLKVLFQRFTVAGAMTGSTAFTPVAIDPADPAALASAFVGQATANGPTLTASAYLLQMTHNMRAMARWVANQGKELVAPAAAGNGIALLPAVLGGAAFTEDVTIEYEE